ncbi:hypothetical protein HPP92_008875 [Vanilla planifolia]|uniref:Uncharacterized protein n=1 Tax=Vanilla planifolia TaxID=51239 RepID=A0A835REU1_VANPL|nr:hypothetical protein HPP92_008875 [Vanilla planifolia]
MWWILSATFRALSAPAWSPRASRMFATRLMRDSERERRSIRMVEEEDENGEESYGSLRSYFHIGSANEALHGWSGYILEFFLELIHS